MDTMGEGAAVTDPNLGSFFLGHLASLVARHAEAASAKERAALGIAAFSVFLDCLDLGLEAPARVILGQYRGELHSPVVA